MHHFNLEIHEDYDNDLHLRSCKHAHDPIQIFRLWQVFITTRDEHDRENTSCVFVLAPDEQGAKSQAGCSRPQVIKSRAIQVPFLIRGFGNLTA